MPFGSDNNSLYIDRAEIPNPKEPSRQDIKQFNDGTIVESKRSFGSMIPWQLWGILLISTTFGLWLFTGWLGQEFCYDNRWVCNTAGFLPFVLLWGVVALSLGYVGLRLYDQWGLARRNQIIRGREGTPVSVHSIIEGILPQYFERMETSQQQTAVNVSRAQPYGASINNLNIRSESLHTTPSGIDGIVHVDAAQPDMKNIDQLRAWLLEHVYHLMIVGATRTGKTTFARAFIKWCVDQGYLVDVITVKARKDEWGMPVIGAGRNVKEITNALAWLDQELTRREQLFAKLSMADDVDQHLPKCVIFIDEILALSVNIDKEIREIWRAFVIKFLTVSAGLNMHIMFLTQSGLVEALGIKNMGDVRKNLARVETSSPLKGVHELCQVVNPWTNDEELIWIDGVEALHTIALQLEVPVHLRAIPRPVPDVQVEPQRNPNAILSVLQENPQGLTINQMVTLTGLRENYIRSEVKRLQSKEEVYEVSRGNRKGSAKIYGVTPKE